LCFKKDKRSPVLVQKRQGGGKRRTVVVLLTYLVVRKELSGLRKEDPTRPVLVPAPDRFGKETKGTSGTYFWEGGGVGGN